MRTVTKSFNVYKYSEASDELKSKIQDEFATCPVYGDFMRDERIETLVKFAEYIEANLNYSISLTPDRGEFISVTPSGSFTNMYRYVELFVNEKKSCPLTGVCYDEDLREYIKESRLLEREDKDEALREVFSKYISAIHSEFEHMLSDEYLSEHCEANEYEFLENGKLY